MQIVLGLSDLSAKGLCSFNVLIGKVKQENQTLKLNQEPFTFRFGIHLMQ